MDWSIISAIISVIVIPIIGLMFATLDKRSKKRQDANKEFNGFMLWGIRAIGGLTKANTMSIKLGTPCSETEEALSEYTRFCTSLEKFTTNQTTQTL